MKKDMPLEGLRWSRDSGSVLYDTPKTAVLGRAGGGIAFANIYEVPKNKNPQPAMGKRVGEIMIDFAFIRKYPIVNYKGYSSKA